MYSSYNKVIKRALLYHCCITRTHTHTHKIHTIPEKGREKQTQVPD